MSNRSLFGLLLVLIGAVFILNSYFNLFEDFASWWPLIIILIGLIQIIKRSTSLLNAFIVIAIGITFLARNLKWVSLEMVFPIILILAGCWLIFSRLAGNTRQSSIDKISYFTLFSGLETNNQSQNFRGGSVATVFGGSDINLRNAHLSEQGAQLELTAVFGGIEVVVPEEWQVQITGTPLFGAWENKTTYIQQDRINSKSLLKINCTVLFGGVTIKN